jgi:hypothetical protein
LTYHFLHFFFLFLKLRKKRDKIKTKLEFKIKFSRLEKLNYQEKFHLYGSQIL